MEHNGRHPNADGKKDYGDTDSHPAPPKAPNPSLDPGVVPKIVHPSFEQVGSIPTSNSFDVNAMDPLLALKILARGVNALADMTGDIPPTPPIASPRVMTPSELRGNPAPNRGHKRIASAVPSHDLKSLNLRNVEIGSPEAHICEPTPLLPNVSQRVIYDAIARKFFSKKPPPISIDDYLLRLHRYCPMSTAVYLAAGVYIHKLSVEEMVVPVTTRTVHRFLLAALRCAMKALEDLNYPSKRFSGVGGVSEKELAKLEISFLYLLDFELRVSSEQLKEKAWALLQLANAGPGSAFHLNLPVRSRRGTVT